MTTKRAKRLERALTQLGWETGIDGTGFPRRCKCGAGESRSNAKFCCVCGAKLPAFKSAASSVYAELEEAIAYALEEKT